MQPTSTARVVTAIFVPECAIEAAKRRPGCRAVITHRWVYNNPHA
jgi:hypothetical protein